MAQAVVVELLCHCHLAVKLGETSDKLLISSVRIYFIVFLCDYSIPVRRLPLMKALYQAGVLMFRRSKNMSKTIS